MKPAYLLAFSAGVMALTVPLENKRDVAVNTVEVRQSTDLLGAIASLGNILAGVQTKLTNDLNTIVTNVGKGITGAGQILSGFVAAITDVTTATSLLTTTITTISNLINPKTVTQAIINDLTAAVSTLTTILTTVQAVEKQIGGVGGVVGNLINSEITALNAVLAPFVGPVEIAVQSVLTSLKGDTAVDLTNLQASLTSLETLAQTLLGVVPPTP